ncbi:MAG: hypothetical protein DRJ59_03945 [Thermoprotei archaeon]|nr:MAG: hypothetical protein DRJ59_03945 [Thermoprotei archaeon]
MGEHEIFCCGAVVRIEDGKVRVLSDPMVEYCPLMELLYGVKNITREVVEKIVKQKIEKYGLFSCCRVFSSSLLVPYGASEIISVCMRKGLLDCAVTVCDGAGTVISSEPALVQEIGARLTGIIKTNPVKETIEYLESRGAIVLDRSTALINQPLGLKKAIELGFRRIATTVTGFTAKWIEDIRALAGEEDVGVTVFSVCNTCVREETLKYLFKADLVWGSASRIVREKIGPKALLQLGVAIPVYALTSKGKELILEYLKEFKDKVVIFRSKLPYRAPDKEPRLR